MFDISMSLPKTREVTIRSSVNDLASLVLATRRGGRRTNAQLDLLEQFGDHLMSLDDDLAMAVQARVSELSGEENGGE
jgi:hypothetical protein